MASTITDYTSLIDVDFPVPGGNNSSQGFRSNFGNIKAALDVASTEVTNLENSLVSLTDNNNFGGNTIQSAEITGCTLVLENYTLSELATLTDEGVENGTIVFVTDTVNSPAYYSGGSWYAITGTVFTP